MNKNWSAIEPRDVENKISHIRVWTLETVKVETNSVEKISSQLLDDCGTTGVAKVYQSQEFGTLYARNSYHQLFTCLLQLCQIFVTVPFHFYVRRRSKYNWIYILWCLFCHSDGQDPVNATVIYRVYIMPSYFKDGMIILGINCVLLVIFLAGLAHSAAVDRKRFKRYSSSLATS